MKNPSFSYCIENALSYLFSYQALLKDESSGY